jgi:dolichol-phosphate mannosyltransferase
MKTGQLQISIPVYNEAENILGVLKEIERDISAPHRINIIYDFDEDTTIPVVEKYIQEKQLDNIALVKNHYGKGALNAIKTGFEVASEGAILVVMADCSDDLKVVDSMVERINQGYDIICGSRYMKGGRQIGGPKFKGLLSRIAGTSLHLLIGIPTHDISNSFKMYRNSVVKEIKIESTGGFEIGMEILIKAFLKGRKISEVPSTWRDRMAGTSRFKLRKWLPKYIRWYAYAITGRLKKRNRSNSLIS